MSVYALMEREELVSTLEQMSNLVKELYTHPIKDLTTEEIKLEAKYFCHSWHSQNPERLVLFARAILKKASEK